MEIAPEAVEAQPAATPERRFRTRDNALVRAIGRIPLPLGAKLLIGFGLVAALLALVVVLGLIALGRSNARGSQLRALQQQTAYEQVLLSDTKQLNSLVTQHQRDSGNGPLNRQSRVTLDESIQRSFDELSLDLANGGSREVRRDVTEFHQVLSTIESQDTLGQGAQFPQTNRAAFTIADAESVLNDLTFRTTARAQALLGQDNRAYRNSRNLLLGIGTGSLLLALAFGLLLSWSVVAPLRRTQGRLARIAAGDFSGHVEVPNRDEIGALAADVNRMNDKLERLYAELETASRHKSDFLATMSHELRTPLNAIIGFSEVLHEQMFGELNERQLAYVDDVLEAGRHLLSLINDVLDLAKIEAGKMELELSQIELPNLLQSAISMHSERAARSGLTTSLSTEPDEITITADERRVRQIVFNLLSNAIKFTPEHGRVDVTARLDDGYAEVAVADTGPGIAAQDQETIFEEFEQTIDGKQAEGTGLGLPLSRKLVELHGGRLWVESQPGRGSTFRFTLPVEAPE